MAEFVVIFMVTSLILLSLACALYFGRPPIYLVTREQALGMLEGLLEGTLPEMKWLVFIGHAITTDPELNEIRLQCNQIELAAEQGKSIAYSANSKRYDNAGLEQIQLVITNLENLIAETPVTKEF